MRFLLDSGVLLRLVNRDDPGHAAIRSAVRRIKNAGHEAVASPQNIAEFWNVCTRTMEARGGLGLDVEETKRRLGVVERIVEVLPDQPQSYTRWKSIVVEAKVRGVQVHDARLVAFMIVYGVTHVLTLNKADFERFDTITAITPSDAFGAGAAPTVAD